MFRGCGIRRGCKTNPLKEMLKQHPWCTVIGSPLQIARRSLVTTGKIQNGLAVEIAQLHIRRVVLSNIRMEQRDVTVGGVERYKRSVLWCVLPVYKVFRSSNPRLKPSVYNLQVQGIKPPCLIIKCWPAHVFIASVYSVGDQVPFQHIGRRKVLKGKCGPLGIVRFVEHDKLVACPANRRVIDEFTRRGL